MKILKCILTVLSLFIGSSGFASEPSIKSGAISIGAPGLEFYEEYTVNKAYPEFEIKSDLCTFHNRKLIFGGCEISNAQNTVRLIGSYPYVRGNIGSGVNPSIEWACKVKNAAQGDRIIVRVICR